MKTALRHAFENIKITRTTRSDPKSLAVRIVERMKTQDSRITRARKAKAEGK